MAAPDVAAIVAHLSQHPRREALATQVRKALLARVSGSPTPANAVQPGPDLPKEQAHTDFGNVYELLDKSALTEPEQAALCALLAFGIAADFPSSPETERGLSRDLLRLATQTRLNVFPFVDVVLNERSASLWQAVANHAARPDPAQGVGLSEALVAAAALKASHSESASNALDDVRERISDPLVRVVLEGNARPAAAALQGELSFLPRGPALTALLAFTLILPVYHTIRMLGRLALAYKHPVTVRLSSRGLELDHHIELLGRVLRQRATLVPLANLARVTREVRYPRIGLYAGLLALVLGSYFGAGLFIDALRVPGGSFPLLGFSVLFIVLGLLLDFGLSSVSDSVRGRCRLVVEPRRGRGLCVGGLDPKLTDAMLASITQTGTP